MTHVDHDLLAGVGGYTQGLPGVQTGEAQMFVCSGCDGRIDGNRLAQLRIQQALGVFQFFQKVRVFRMFFSADRVGGIQPGAKRSNGVRIYLRFQGDVQIVCVRCV